MPNSSKIASAQYAKATVTLSAKPTASVTKNAWPFAPGIVVYKDPTVKQKEKKKMGWLKKKFAQWSRDAWEEAQKTEYVVASPRASESINGGTSLRFTIYPASGGYVIEYYKQDRYKENDGPTLTIVNNGDSIGTAVEHIITLEALKA